ncbi:MAG: hypothetical protein GQ570_02640 [Helicobacteraceae bacterium]|nr:hypothetical protein [Helicobacteraceae bacterium]
MAKKKTIINVSSQKLSFIIDDMEYKLISFDPNKMCVDVNIHEVGQKVKKDQIPFAHIPKDLKKLLKPFKG